MQHIEDEDYTFLVQEGLWSDFKVFPWVKCRGLENYSTKDWITVVMGTGELKFSLENWRIIV